MRKIKQIQIVLDLCFSYVFCIYHQYTCLAFTINTIVLHLPSTHLSCIYHQHTCLKDKNCDRIEFFAEERIVKDSGVF